MTRMVQLYLAKFLSSLDDSRMNKTSSSVWRVEAVCLGAEAEAAKTEPKNIRAEASRISVEPKPQNV